MELKFNTWQEFFDTIGDFVITMIYYESKQSINVEELYQHFKERLKAEIKEE